MNSKDLQYIAESYSRIVSEASADLEALRQAAARATLAGPSREAQALMSSRTKALLGPEKLKAGLEAQKNVETMKSGQPPAATATPASSSTSTPAAKPEPPATPAATPTPTPRPSAPPTSATTQQPAPPTSPTLTQRQIDTYNQAYRWRNNSMARSRIQGEIDKLTPEQKKLFQQYAQSRGHGNDWRDYKFESYSMNSMKTFQQFMEQIPTVSMHLNPEREKTRREIEVQRRISSRQHRRHVHGELARTANYELSHKSSIPIG